VIQDDVLERVRKIGGEFGRQFNAWSATLTEMAAQALCELFEEHPEFNTEKGAHKLLWSARFTDGTKFVNCLVGSLSVCSSEQLLMAIQVVSQNREWLRHDDDRTCAHLVPEVIDLFGLLWVLALQGCQVHSAKALERCCLLLCCDYKVAIMNITDHHATITDNLAALREAASS
jgi:hypothetical protein